MSSKRRNSQAKTKMTFTLLNHRGAVPMVKSYGSGGMQLMEVSAYRTIRPIGLCGVGVTS